MPEVIPSPEEQRAARKRLKMMFFPDAPPPKPKPRRRLTPPKPVKKQRRAVAITPDDYRPLVIPNPTLALIVRVVARTYDLPVVSIAGNDLTSDARVMLAKRACWFLAKELTDLGISLIAKEFGYQPNTISQGICTFKRLVAREKSLASWATEMMLRIAPPDLNHPDDLFPMPEEKSITELSGGEG